MHEELPGHTADLVWLMDYYFLSHHSEVLLSIAICAVAAPSVPTLTPLSIVLYDDLHIIPVRQLGESSSVGFIIN